MPLYESAVEYKELNYQKDACISFEGSVSKEQLKKLSIDFAQQLLSQSSNESLDEYSMYLDDLRTPIEEFDFIVRSYEEAVSVMSRNGVPDFISFDHDLGCTTNGELLKSGFDVVKWMVKNDR
ncbi:hypothetical protein JHD46_02075 [Sulfurimonas sp. SAG-AH-194-C20]|nr:cyclic-phosphate processing receiver domain-containing protein [Sulfurimonas sp. SAG-AH-194-C20]MDF1878423.1 hypothetical protein [Sulfurimonas sp. SAG-AH-194-C20]